MWKNLVNHINKFIDNMEEDDPEESFEGDGTETGRSLDLTDGDLTPF